MKKQAIQAAALLLSFVLAGCSANNNTNPDATAAQTPAETPAISAEVQLTTEDAVPTAGTITMGSAAFDDTDKYTVWSGETYTGVAFDGDTISVAGTGAKADQGALMITAAGTYVLSGTLDDGVVLVNAGDEAQVRIVLNGASISCSTGAPLFIMNAKSVMVSLAPGTQNTLHDGTEYSYYYYDASTEEPAAALFSKDDMVINGTGELHITAQYNDGIACNDALKIVEGTLIIKALDDGIVGKDMVAAQNAQITISSGGDGIKSTNAKDTGKGFIAIADGTYIIHSGADGLQAETELYIENGSFDITTGGGSASVQHQSQRGGMMPEGAQGGTRPEDGAFMQGTPPQDGTFPQEGMPELRERSNSGIVNEDSSVNANEGGESTAVGEQKPNAQSEQSTEAVSTTGSYQAIKAGSFLHITGGSFTLDSEEDALHSNSGLAITGGSLSISAGDDGIHADDSICIANGLISILKSYEGIEAMRVDITGGEIDILSSDDGLNIAGGNDNSGSTGGRDMFAELDGARFLISGGIIRMDAAGDGLDTNGSGYITGGEVYVSGPTNNGNGALDYNGAFEITGGILVAAGSAGMAQAPSDGTTQPSIAGNLDLAQEAGSVLTLIDASGSVVLSFAPAKAYQYVAFSSPDLIAGATYTIAVDGTAVQEVTLTETVTTFSLTGGNGMGRGMRGQDQAQQTAAPTA